MDGRQAKCHSPTMKAAFGAGLTPITTRVWPRRYNPDGEVIGEATSEELLYDEFETTTFKVDDAIQKLNFGLFHWAVIITLFTSRVLCSAHYALAIIIIPTLTDEFEWNRYVRLAMQCAIFAGSLAGAIPMGKMSDKYGRKTTALFGLTIMIIFAVGSIFCHRVPIIILLKFFEGFFLQGVVILPVYLTEVLATEYRTVSNTVCQIGLPVGYLLTGVLAFYLLPQIGWRGLTGSVCVLGLVTLPMLAVLPMSPRQLALLGENNSAYSSLKSITRINGGKLQSGVLRDIGRIPKDRMGELRCIFRDRCASHLSIVIWIGRFLTQFAIVGSQLGGSILLWDPFYTKDELRPLTFNYFQSMNSTNSSAYNNTELAVFSTGAVGEIIGSIALVPLISHLGVKQNLFLTTSIYTIVSIYIVTGILLHQRWMVIFCTVTARAVARASVNLMVVYTPDAYPTLFRATAFSVSDMFVSLAILVGVLLSELLSESNFILELCFFSTSSFLASMSLAFLPIETKERPIEET